VEPLICDVGVWHCLTFRVGFVVFRRLIGTQHTVEEPGQRRTPPRVDPRTSRRRAQLTGTCCFAETGSGHQRHGDLDCRDTRSRPGWVSRASYQPTSRPGRMCPDGPTGDTWQSLDRFDSRPQRGFPPVLLAAASASRLRSAVRMLAMSWLPSWQAYSYRGRSVRVMGTDTVQGVVQTVGSVMVHS